MSSYIYLHNASDLDVLCLCKSRIFESRGRI